MMAVSQLAANRLSDYVSFHMLENWKCQTNHCPTLDRVQQRVSQSW